MKVVWWYVCGRLLGAINWLWLSAAGLIVICPFHAPLLQPGLLPGPAHAAGYCRGEREATRLMRMPRIWLHTRCAGSYANVLPYLLRVFPLCMP